MKRLILLLIFLCSLGLYCQELALSNFNEDGTPSHKAVNETAKKLIKKGDEYFDKMWYAEAARIYDVVLEKTKTKHSMHLLSRAGDSHYYIGNLEKSYKWYNELYQLYPEQISNSTLFKYTQTLKGIGKHQRAAELSDAVKQKMDLPLNELTYQKTNMPKVAGAAKIKNLGINSKYSDFSPMFYKDSSIVYSSAKDTSFLTTRRYRWTNQPFLDLYIAKSMGVNGNFSSKKFSNKINTKFHEASLAFSSDEKTIYFTRNNYGKKLKRGKNGINHLKLYRSQLISGEWSKAEELPFNSEDYSTGHPTISPDGTKLYFVSDRPGGFGETDIYMVEIYENGGFSEPKNLGSTINTEAKEMFPYTTEKALYFSSDRPSGHGGLDIYRSTTTKNTFSSGVNLGKPINSIRDDFSFIIDSTGSKGYFASNRSGGKGDDDIYSFEYAPNLNAVTGLVKSKSTGEVIDEAEIYLYGQDGVLINKSISDASGVYVFNYLSPETDYTVVAQKEGYIKDSILVQTKDNTNIKISQFLEALKTDKKDKTIADTFEPGNVYFDFDSFEINAHSAQELQKLIATLKEHEELSLKIESHTDAIGPRSYNMYLSEKRAESTKSYLISQGIAPSRIISAIGYGEERLLNNCSDGKQCTSEKHLLNRRSEFILVSG